MAEVKLAINGRLYSIACDDGQERRVSMLGRYIDTRLKEIARAGGASNESHLLVLTALVLADEIHDLRDDLENTMRALRLKNLESAKREPDAKLASAASENEQQITEALEKISLRIGSLAERLESEAA